MGLSQWSQVGDDFFVPSSTTCKILPPGKYTIQFGLSGVFFKPVEIITDELVDIQDSLIYKILRDIDHFWTRGEAFKSHGFLHRRGYLLWGPQGTGKSCALAGIARRLIASGGIVFNCDCPEDLSRGLKIFREVEPARPVVCLFEDLDTIIDCYSESDVLALLDGEDQVDKVVNIATTNFPENLPARLLQRPRRFDRIYEIGNPDERLRQAFFQAKLSPEDLAKVPLEKWVSATSNFSFAGLTDLIISVVCLDNSFSESLEAIRSVMDGGNILARKGKKSRRRGRIRHVNNYEEPEDDYDTD